MTPPAIICLVLFELGTLALYYLIYRLIKAHTPWKTVFLTAWFALITKVTGIAFVTAGDYRQFGFLALSLAAWCFTLPFMLFHFFPGKKAEKIINWVMTGIFFVLFLVKLSFTVFAFEPSNVVVSAYEILPLNICNLVAILILLRPFLKIDLLDNYLLVFGIVGFFINQLLGDWFSNKEQFIGALNDFVNTGSLNFFNPRTLESSLVHDFYIIYVLYLILTRSVNPNPKKAIWNFVWILPLYYVLVFTNQIFKFNFFFNSEYRNPMAFLYNAMFNLGGFYIGSFKINFLYDIILLGAIHLGLWVIAYGMKKFQNRFGSKVESVAPTAEQHQPTPVTVAS
jgi:hypothetical protein